MKGHTLNSVKQDGRERIFQRSSGCIEKNFPTLGGSYAFGKCHVMKTVEQGPRESWTLLFFLFPSLKGVSSDTAVAVTWPPLLPQRVERGIGAFLL